MKKYITIIICLSLALHSGLTLANINTNTKSAHSIRGVTVVSSPYMGERSRFESSDLIVKIPGMQQSLRLLQQLQKAENFYKAKGLQFTHEPLLDLSGAVGVLASTSSSYSGKTKSDINLASAELDIFARINSWSSAFFNIKYDSSSFDFGSNAQNVSIRAVDNARFFLDEGFVTLGNLNQCSIFMTAGQIHVPFGTGSTGLISGPITRSFYDVKQRALLVGYKAAGTNSIYVAGYGFKGITSYNRIDGGLNIVYNFSKSSLRGKLSGGIISNIIEAKLYQLGGNNFKGFARVAEPKNRVPGITIFASLAYKNIALQGEIVTATKNFNKEFVTQNNYAITPQAINLEASLGFSISKIPASLTIGYGSTRNAFVFNKPAHRVSAALVMAPLKSTILGLEIKHDINYKHGTTVQFLENDGTSGKAKITMPQASLNDLGKSSTAASIFWGYYF